MSVADQVKTKILVVDDEPANVELLVRMLRRRYDVRTAASGPEALKQLEAGLIESARAFVALLRDYAAAGRILSLS